jgi:hypothetical protein
MAEADSIDVIRISIVRQYYAIDEKLSSTPAPFAEFRIFRYYRILPRRIYIEIILNAMKKELDILEKLFQSIDLVKDRLPSQTGKQYIRWEDKEEIHRIQAKPVIRGKGAKILIDGLEIEKVSMQEVLQFFKKFKRRIKFGETYRYACFYDVSGNPKKEYSDDEIQEISAQFGAELFFEQ